MLKYNILKTSGCGEIDHIVKVGESIWGFPYEINDLYCHKEYVIRDLFSRTCGCTYVFTEVELKN